MIWGYEPFANVNLPYDTGLLLREAQRTFGFTETMGQVAARAVKEYVENVVEMHLTLKEREEYHVEGAPQEPAARGEGTAEHEGAAQAQ